MYYIVFGKLLSTVIMMKMLMMATMYHMPHLHNNFKTLDAHLRTNIPTTIIDSLVQFTDLFAFVTAHMIRVMYAGIYVLYI